MKKAVIFDLDGLLIDTESTCFKIYGDLVRKYGHELTLAAYTERYSGKALIDNVNQFIADFDLPITLEEGAEFYTSFRPRHTAEARRRGAFEEAQSARRAHHPCYLQRP